MGSCRYTELTTQPFILGQGDINAMSYI